MTYQSPLARLLANPTATDTRTQTYAVSLARNWGRWSEESIDGESVLTDTRAKDVLNAEFDESVTDEDVESVLRELESLSKGGYRAVDTEKGLLLVSDS